MTSPEVINRLEAIEREQTEAREMRHERNEHIVTVVDQLRVEHLSLLEDHKDAVARLGRIEAAVERLVGAMEGTLGFSGIVATQQEQGDDIQELKDWQRDIKGFIGGMMFVAAIAGGAVASTIGWIGSHLK